MNSNSLLNPPKLPLQNLFPDAPNYSRGEVNQLIEGYAKFENNNTNAYAIKLFLVEINAFLSATTLDENFKTSRDKAPVNTTCFVSMNKALTDIETRYQETRAEQDRKILDIAIKYAREILQKQIQQLHNAKDRLYRDGYEKNVGGLKDLLQHPIHNKQIKP